MGKGKIGLDRKILDWEWWGDKIVEHPFITLLILANYKDNNHKGKLVKRGQVVCSLESLARDSKCSVRQIRTALHKLQETGEIVIEATHRGSIITIVNYNKYQDFTGDDSNKRQANDTPSDKLMTRQTTTTNNSNKENKVITTTGGVNSSDYFDVKGADLRSSESDTNSYILWAELNSLWVTNEYQASLQKLYKTYWVKMAQADQELLLSYLKNCSDPNLSKVWKKPLFESGNATPELLTKELSKYTKSKTHVYINESNEQLAQGKKRIDFKAINKT